MFSKEDLTNYKKTLTLAYPICLSQLGHILVTVVDTAFVGQIGTTEQAAASIASNFFVLPLVFIIGVSVGITPLVAIATGEKNENRISELLKNGMVGISMIGVLVFILLLMASPLLNMLSQSHQVIALAIPFFNVMVFSLMPLTIFSIFKQFAEGLSDTKTAMIISVASNIINVFLNYVFIFGKLGFSPMGLMGSCWATFWSRIIMCIWMVLYVYYHKKFSFYWKDLPRVTISYKNIQNILKIGVPAGLQWLFEVGAFSFAVIMIGWIGVKEQAAHQIALSLAAITYMISSGVASATSVRIGNELGAKNFNGVKKIGLSSYVIIIGIMLISAVGFILLRNVLPVLFNTNAEVIAITSKLLIIAAFFQLFDGTQALGVGILRGLKDVKIPTIIAFLTYWAISLPLGYFFSFKLQQGVYGIWWGLSVGLIVASLLFAYRYHIILKRARNNSGSF